MPTADDLRPGLVRRDERPGSARAGCRWTTGFDWSLVPRDVQAALLQAAGPGDELGQVGGRGTRGSDAGDASHQILTAAARQVFGQTLTQRAMRRVGPTLVEVWLPVASDATLEALAAMVKAGLGPPYRDERLRSRRERLRFLQARRRTHNYYSNLRRAFLREYRASWLVPTGPRRAAADNVYALRGAGRPPAYEPYDHAREAWSALDRLAAAGPVRGLVVLPTGAGKTDVAIAWALSRMRRDPELRVMWLAHQVALLDQAAVRFDVLTRELPPSFKRTLRIFASGAEPMRLFNPRKTDVACATIQTVSRKLGQKSKRRAQVTAFLKSPTLLVIDEAHHVGWRGYQTLLEDLVADEAIHDVIGLTATPWAHGQAKQDKIDNAFPQRVITRTREELVAAGVLADYKVIPIRTHVAIEVARDERAQTAQLGDFPMSVLRKLETAERNAAVVRAYQGAPERWGRTLLFTTTIENAERLGRMLADAGATVQVLHSRSDTTLAALRPWFQEHDHAVIVSVGMLLEGVDLPQARTALIARATTSRVVLSQMVGRVLRGPMAGGEAGANVVYMADDWGDFVGALVPTGDWAGPDEEPAAARRPPFPADVAAAVAAALEAARRSAREAWEKARRPGRADQEPPLPGLEVILEERQIVGFYETLDDTKIPVFDNQEPALTRHLEAFAAGAPGSFGWPAEAPPPAVADEHLAELEHYVQARGVVPPFHPLALTVAPIQVAETLNDGRARSRADVRALIAAAYSDPLASAVFPSLLHFEEAVYRWQRELERRRVRPEAPLPRRAGSRKPLPRAPGRSLDAAIALALDRGERLLPATRRERLIRPQIEWSARVSSSYLALWRLAPEPPIHRITVNVLLQTDESLVSDDQLGFLIWHELVHSVTPGQGHDAEFYELETRWPNAVEIDADLDELFRSWSADPRDYA